MTDWIINSLLDTDSYKTSMAQVVLHRFPGTQVEYAFKCRNREANGHKIDLAKYADRINGEIDHLCTLKFTKPESAWLRTIRWLKSDFVDFLALLQLRRDFVTVEPQANGEIEIKVKGPWLHTIWFEIPILSIVNETYFDGEFGTPNGDYAEAECRLEGKIKSIRDFTAENPGIPFNYADFGTRRRRSSAVQDMVVRKLAMAKAGNFIGTSNPLLAMKYDVTPIGTMAHEFVCACQGIPGVQLRDSQKFALDNWVSEFRGDLGYALSDTLGFDAFLRDFDLFFVKLFDGCRHDSGDPYEWGEKLIAHYRSFKINPATKQGVFSDGLDFPKAFALCKHFHGRLQTSFGIGTNLTGDCGHDALQIVMKLVSANGHSVAKISDSPGKGMCQDEEYLSYLKKIFQIP